MAKVLVVGGGFAGVEASIYLRKDNHEVTLLSDREYLYVYPISIWVPTGEADFEDITLSLSELSSTHGFKFIKDEVTEIKAKEMKITTKSREYSDFDYLVIAVGQGKLKPKGSKYFLSICGEPHEAKEMKNRLNDLISRGEGKIIFGFGGNPKDTSAVRGGPVFEVMFNVHNQLKKLGIRDKYELTFFAPMKEPGAKMGEKALVMMDKFFKRLNINKKVGTKIIEFKEDRVVFEDGSELESDLTIFTPAGSKHTLFTKSDLPLSDSGFIVVDEFCVVDGMERVFAIGDSAVLNGPDWRAKQGHVAEVMARNSAANITYLENGRKPQKSYLDHINILCVMDTGDGAALVYRDNKRDIMIPMPIIGHWLKKGWGVYYKLSKHNRVPRIPGM